MDDSDINIWPGCFQLCVPPPGQKTRISGKTYGVLANVGLETSGNSIMPEMENLETPQGAGNALNI
jgi:hypothetical protein